MKLKSAVIGFSYLAGLIFAFLLADSPLQGGSLNLIIFITGIIAGLFLIVKKVQPNVGAFLLVFGIAFGVFALYKATTLDFIHELDGQTRSVTGIVTDKTLPSHDMAGYTVEAVIDNVKVGFSLYAPDTGAEIGDRISFDAAFTFLRDNTAFAESSYYMSKGIFLKATAKSTPIAEKQYGFSLSGLFAGAIRDFNQSLKSKVLTAFPNDVGALICAVFLGDKSRLSPALSKSISRAGAAHFTAVSGLHLTLIAHLFMSVLNLTRFRVMRKTKFFFLAFLTFTFMVFFNLSPSVTRAGIMLIVFYGGELFMRRGNTLNSIGLAALIILLFSPFACLDAGFLLSVAGTIGIGVIAPAITQRLNRHSAGVNAFIPLTGFRELFIGNLCANYATLPLVAIFFGGAPLVSPVTSIILLPFFTVLVASMVIFAITAAVGLGGLPLLIAGIMSRLMGVVINFFGGLKFAYIPLDYSFITSWVIISVMFTALTGFFYKDVLKAAKAGVISLFALAFMVISSEYLDLDKTRFEIYSDGSSASIFLRYKNNSAVIVTNDGIRTAYAAEDFISNNFLNEIGLLCVLNSTNNSLPYFSEIPALEFKPPDDEFIIYDVGGVFTVTIDGNEAFIIYNDTELSVTHVRSSSDSDINITYGFSINAGEFNGLVINTARRQEVIRPDELNAFFEKINWVLN